MQTLLNLLAPGQQAAAFVAAPFIILSAIFVLGSFAVCIICLHYGGLVMADWLLRLEASRNEKYLCGSCEYWSENSNGFNVGEGICAVTLPPQLWKVADMHRTECWCNDSCAMWRKKENPTW